jgi:hypothetical protein
MLAAPSKGKKPQLDLLDLPRFTRENLGLAGINLSTDLLAGADRSRLEAIRERADRVSCACLLLIEPDAQNFGSGDESLVAAAIHRTIRVAEAAHILGCSSIAIRAKGPDDDAGLLRVAAALKKVVERAEKLDINLLLAPDAGLTSKPERLTELLKKVGGFRVGTFPDFQAAAATSDPAGYLHRLTPYATSVCASTVKLVGDAEAKPTRGGSKEMRDALAADIAAIAKAGNPAAAGKGKDAPALDDEELEELEATIASAKGKKGKKDDKTKDDKGKDSKATGKKAKAQEAEAKGAKKGKGKKDVAPPPPPAVEEELEDLDDADMDELEALIDDVIDEGDIIPRLIAFEHEPYDLRPLIAAVTAVGYDGSLSLDYRGTGDVVMGLTQTRDTLIALIAEAKKVGA